MIAYVLLRVFVILLLVAANAFFAAAEFALVSVRETRILQLIESHRAGARTVLKLHQQLQRVVNGVQLGITVTSLSLGWLGEPVLARLFETWIGSIPHAILYAHAIAVTVAFVAITSLHVILGELVPKSLALQRAERVALAVAAPMDVFLTITRPVTVGMSRVARFVLRAFGTREIRHGSVHSPDELKLIVTAAHHSGQLSSAQEEMLLNALELDSITARQVMVPRTRIFSLPADLNLDEALSRVVDDQHSRVPVYDPTTGPEDIIGIVYSKDISRLMHFRTVALSMGGQGESGLTLYNVMRELSVVPETKLAIELLQEFQERRRQIAIVVDEFGSTVGIVTAEDVLEQIVGELEDEFDVSKSPLLSTTGAMSLDGSTTLRDLGNQLRWTFPREAGVETLAGFLLAQFGHIPTVGESLEYEGRRYRVAEMTGHRISRVIVEDIVPPQQGPADEVDSTEATQ